MINNLKNINNTGSLDSFLVSKSNFPKGKSVKIIPGLEIGNGHFQVISGPCSVESKNQITQIANDIKKSGATILRGGAFKLRTSPYSFQGMREEGLEYLLHAKKSSGLPIVSEILDISQLPLFEQVDIIQVGARNMQNYELLKALGKIDKPILLKRGISNTIHEFLLSAEYILSNGNDRVILCERGIRTFESAYRNTLDLTAIPVLKSYTHLPVIVDPSHATGISSLVKPMALAATVAGADGLMIEVHNSPKEALCDGIQSITPSEFSNLMQTIKKVLPFAYSLSEESNKC